MAQIVIQKSIPEQARREVIDAFKKINDWRGFNYVVVAWIAHFYLRGNMTRLRLIPIGVSIAAALFKKKPKEVSDEDFEVIPL